MGDFLCLYFGSGDECWGCGGFLGDHPVAEHFCSIECKEASDG